MKRPGTDVIVATTLGLVLLAPCVAHLLWRPIATVALGPLQGIALGISWAAVAIAAVTAALVVWCVGGGRSDVTWGGGLALGGGVGWAIGGVAGAFALLAVALVTLAALPVMMRSLEATQAALERRPGRGWLVFWGALVALGVVGVVDVTTYMADPDAVAHGMGHGTMVHRHLCYTAYVHAAELLNAGVADVYDLALTPPATQGEWPASAAHMAPFTLDRYGYPPQFLLVPLAIGAVIDDFMAQRAFWTCANAVFFAWVLWRVGLWVGPRGGRVARWSAPFLWLSCLPTFQTGNVQLIVLGLGVLAMIAFHERRDAIGGLWLAAVTVSKIAPGLLGVVLLVRRRWAAAAWTVGAAVAISALALAVMGSGVFEAFLNGHLPRIASGEAYDFLDDTPANLRDNLAPFGLPFKLVALGVTTADPWVWGPRLGMIYTVIVFGLTIMAARRPLDRRAMAAVAMLVLTCAALRSPMSPGYLLSGAAWALTLVGAEVQRVRGWLVGAALTVAMTLTLPFFPFGLWVAIGGQAVMHGVIIWLMLRRWPALEPERAPAR